MLIKSIEDSLLETKNKLVNAEGLPIESIDRIQVSLNPRLNPFIHFENRNIDPKKYLRLWYSKKYGLRWFMDIQAQKIDMLNIRGSIAKAIFEILNNGFIMFPITIPFEFVYMHLDIFIIYIRQIEFAFDFKPEDVTIIDPSSFIQFESTFYSNDYRCRDGRQTRYSFIDLYCRNPYLLKMNKISPKIINNNPFSMRLEFLIARNNNSKRLTLDNISGSYHQVMTRHIPYLAIIFHNYFYKKVSINVNQHLYFSQIYALAMENKKRYTGKHLEKTKTHQQSNIENNFYDMMNMLQFPIQKLVEQTLSNCD